MSIHPLRELTDDNLLSMLEETRFAFSMHGWAGDPADFFAPSRDRENILVERTASLGENRPRYLGARPEAEPSLRELTELAGQWLNFPVTITAETPEERCLKLALILEPDFVLLAPNDNGQYHGAAGAVCFPSDWDIRMALGRRMQQIHSRVPGLNEKLADAIDSHFAALAPAESWSRLNWGITVSPNRNQHPLEKIPRLADADEFEDVWLRVELQVLSKLPESGAILFGIRPHHIHFDIFRSHPEVAATLGNHLANSSQALLDYKGIGQNAPLLDKWLQL